MTIHLRAADFRPSTVDLEARTVEAIAATGADVDRGSFIERLNLPGTDLSKVDGAPVLDAHKADSTRSILGVIEEHGLRPEGLWIRIRFRQNEAATAVLADIADGTIRGLSIGYTVSKWKTTREGGRIVRTAPAPKIHEVSIVPVPADPGAHFRTGDGQMDPEELEVPPDTGATLTRAEVNREIRTIATTAGLSRAWADEQIDAEADPDAARAAAFAAMQERGQRVRVIRDHDAPDERISRAGEALYARAHPEHELSPAAQSLAYMTPLDHARESLRRSGIRTTGMAANDVITRGLHMTGDFPLILGDMVGRELRRAYQAAPSGIRTLARQTSHRDFRAKHALQFGEAPELHKVPEGGEFTHGTIDEAGESYRLHTFGRIIALSRQALINDDLGAFTQITGKMGAAVRAFEAIKLVELLEANPLMSDGVTVFAADHGNHTSPYDEPGEVSLTAAHLAMRKQTGLSGGLIDVTPKYVVVPPALETKAEKALSAIQAHKTSEVNPFAALQLIVEPRLSASNVWYVAADPATVDGIEYAYLEGAPGPQIETRAGFEIDGVQIKVRLDFGCGWLDWRGWHKIAAA